MTQALLKPLLRLSIFSAFFLGGCASILHQKYSTLLNTAIAEGRAVTIISSEPFEDLKDKVLLKALSLGYERTVVNEPHQGFLVAVKKNSAKNAAIGDALAFPLLIKFTDAGEGKTRLDFVNGAYNILAKKEIQKDIQILSQFIHGKSGL